MKTRRIVAAIGMVVGGALTAQPLFAQTAPFPTLARSYTAWMARAMDKCDPSTVSVVNIGNIPTSGCYQANVDTDDSVSPGAKMNWARVVVRTTRAHAGKVALTGRGFYGAQRLQVYLKLRVTKQGQVTQHPPNSNASVTFQDVEVLCGNNTTTGCFTANLRGSVAGSVALTSCLAANGEATGLATGNVEILDSALVNCDTGKVVGKPGMLIK